MATAAPFVKLLRQLSSAKDEYRSGALDISWDGAKATLFFVFGQPNQATYEDDGGGRLEGQPAVAALLHNLPSKFTVAPWRKEVVRDETLKLTVDELMEPFAQLAGARADAIDDGTTSKSSLDVGTEIAVDFDFSLADFPMLPLGESMWSDAAINVVHLDLLIPKLPTALIVLTGPKLRAAAVVFNGQLIDAVWVDEQERAAGEGAAMALMGVTQGTVSCYRLEHPKLAEALTMLWRCPIRYRDVNLAWLDVDAFLASLTADQRDCVLQIRGRNPAVALFLGGKFIAGYSAEQRMPSTSLADIEAIMRGEGTFTILQRATDLAIGRSVSEADYHSYVAPALAEVEAPSYAVGAASLAGDDDYASVAATAAPAEAAADTAVAPDYFGHEAVLPDYFAPDPDAPSAPIPDYFAADPGEPEPNDPEAAAPEAAMAEPDTFDYAANGSAEAPEAAETEVVEPAVSEPEAAEPPDWMTSAAEAPEAAEIGEFQDPIAEPSDAAGSNDAAALNLPMAANDWAVAPDAATAPDAVLADAQPPLLTPLIFGNGTAAPIETAPEEDPGYEPPRIDLDFEGIKDDLIKIGELWLGAEDVKPVAELIRNTKPSVDDFVATIDAIKGIAVSGHDPSVIRAMAREMHYHAAEYLSGA